MKIIYRGIAWCASLNELSKSH